MPRVHVAESRHTSPASHFLRTIIISGKSITTPPPLKLSTMLQYKSCREELCLYLCHSACSKLSIDHFYRVVNHVMARMQANGNRRSEDCQTVFIVYIFTPMLRVEISCSKAACVQPHSKAGRSASFEAWLADSLGEQLNWSRGLVSSHRNACLPLFLSD